MLPSEKKVTLACKDAGISKEITDALINESKTKSLGFIIDLIYGVKKGTIQLFLSDKGVYAELTTKGKAEVEDILRYKGLRIQKDS